MANLFEAFQPEGGINLNDLVGIFAGTANPSVAGEVAPIGSLFIRNNGTLFQKTGLLNSEWSLVGGGAGGNGTVAITSNDTTPDVLFNKLTVSSALTKTVQNAGANEHLFLDLATVATAGTYTQVVINNKGQVLSGANPGFITGNQTITLSGDVTGIGSTSIVTTLRNTTVTPGTYNGGSFIVNSQGRITAAVNNQVYDSITAGVNGVGLTANTHITDTSSGGWSSRSVQLRYQLAPILQAIGVMTTTGILVSPSANTIATRALSAGSCKIAVTNGGGVLAAPITVDLGSVALDDLSNVAAIAPAVGDRLFWNGAQWVPGGGAGGGGGLRTWSGNITSTTGTTVFTPSANAPGITGGTQLAAQTITPLSTLSKFTIQVALSASASASNNIVHTCAVFRTIAGVSTYIGGAIQTFASSGNSTAISVCLTDAPATVSSVTYSIRYGTSSGTWYVNRRTIENTYGGVRSGWEIQEY